MSRFLVRTLVTLAVGVMLGCAVSTEPNEIGADTTHVRGDVIAEPNGELGATSAPIDIAHPGRRAPTTGNPNANRQAEPQPLPWMEPQPEPWTVAKGTGTSNGGQSSSSSSGSQK